MSSLTVFIVGSNSRFMQLRCYFALQTTIRKTHVTQTFSTAGSLESKAMFILASADAFKHEIYFFLKCRRRSQMLTDAHRSPWTQDNLQMFAPESMWSFIEA